MKNLTYFLGVALLATACSVHTGNNGESDAMETAVNQYEICGTWNMDTISVSDSIVVVPAKEVPEVMQYMKFNSDNSFFIATNCNSISGFYEISGDSITLGVGPMTMMACENTATEDALRQVLGNINTVAFKNDSVLRLNTDNKTQYIILSKAEEAE